MNLPVSLRLVCPLGSRQRRYGHILPSTRAGQLALTKFVPDEFVARLRYSRKGSVAPQNTHQSSPNQCSNNPSNDKHSFNRRQYD